MKPNKNYNNLNAQLSAFQAIKKLFRWVNIFPLFIHCNIVAVARFIYCNIVAVARFIYCNIVAVAIFIYCNIVAKFIHCNIVAEAKFILAINQLMERRLKEKLTRMEAFFVTRVKQNKNIGTDFTYFKCMFHNSGDERVFLTYKYMIFLEKLSMLLH